MSFQPTGVSFVDPLHGWGIGNLGCQTCLGLEVTSDGGATWDELPPPGVSLGRDSPSSVSNIFFANAKDGYLFAPGLEVTSDGGHDWSTGSVSSVEQLTEADGDAFVLSQLPSGAGPVELFRAPVGGDAWTRVLLPPPAASSSSQSVPSDQVVGEGDTLLLLQKGLFGPQPPVAQVGGLWTSTDAGNHWDARREPCIPSDGGAAVASIAFGHPDAWLVDCFDNEQSQQAQMTQHHLYGTADAGASWARLSDPAQTGDPEQLADNGAGHAFLTIESGGRDDLVATLDGGGSWNTVLSEPIGFSGWSDLQFVSSSTGFLIGPVGTPADILYRTADGGRIWSAVTFPQDQLVPALQTHNPMVTVTPATNLVDGEQITVRVSGFDLGGKFFVSECADTSDVSSEGCGPQLAAQPFGVTDDFGSGSMIFVVSSRASSSSVAPKTAAPCTAHCVIVATVGGGYGYASAPISFAAR